MKSAVASFAFQFSIRTTTPSLRYPAPPSLPACNTTTPRETTKLLDGGAILDAVAGLPSYTEHDAREIATAVLRALQHAHDDAGCVHRDLRPEKLLLSRDPAGNALLGVGQRVKVAGWGRSKRLPPGGLVPGEFCFGNRGEKKMTAGESLEVSEKGAHFFRSYLESPGRKPSKLEVRIANAVNVTRSVRHTNACTQIHRCRCT